MKTELLVPVDWNAWKRLKTAVSKQVQNDREQPHHLTEVECIAVLVLGLERHRDRKGATKIVRMALREIETTLLGVEQDIDYL